MGKTMDGAQKDRIRARRNLILSLVGNGDIATQNEITEMLARQGFDVTQATVSRDMRQLGFSKTRGEDGRYYYRAVRRDKDTGRTGMDPMFRNAIKMVDCAQNLVVIRCVEGMAQGICAMMDGLEWDGVLGTLAGDDTILVIARTKEGAAGIVRELNSILDAAGAEA